ncbi:MAG: sulfotransferase domain-containing protein [Chlamydiae bacterium]|nr:sulfotransferase domain-containing protein [Chlamydiota bacterium]
MRYFFSFLFVCSSLFASSIPVFENIKKTEDSIFLITTERSGSNWLSTSLSLITRKPISWIEWKYKIHVNHPSYNRLNIELVSDNPLLYRTHLPNGLIKKVPRDKNKLIFLTRNPKEILFRSLLLKEMRETDKRIWNFIDNYLEYFNLYESFHKTNRKLIFYEDFIHHHEEILLDVLDFMNEPATFWEDFILNKNFYFSSILSSYKDQHRSVDGGKSSQNGATEKFYSLDISKELLKKIDLYIQKAAPKIWEDHLSRFAD